LEDLGHVVLDGARAQEQLGGDLRVRQARPGQPRDLGLLGGELLVRAGGAPAGGLAGGPQLAPGPPGDPGTPPHRHSGPCFGYVLDGEPALGLRDAEPAA